MFGVQALVAVKTSAWREQTLDSGSAGVLCVLAHQLRWQAG
jgi:hypothetical protein